MKSDQYVSHVQRPSIHLVILMPVFEDRDSVQIILRDLKRDIPEPFRVICIEDGSLDNPLVIDDLHEAGVEGEIVFLSRNMGHQRAIAAGIRYVSDNYKADYTVIMDSDGEDRPDSVVDLLCALDDNADVVAASRKSRQESVYFKAFYLIYKLIFKMLTGRFVNFGNYMVLNQCALTRMAAVNETWLHVAGAVLLSRARIKTVPLDRGKRYRGQSKMNFSQLVLHGMRAVMVFAEDVLVRILMICLTSMVLLIIAMVIIVLMKVNGLSSPGWATTSMGIMLIILVQMGSTVLFMLLSSGAQKGQAPLPAHSVNALIRAVERTPENVALNVGNNPVP